MNILKNILNGAFLQKITSKNLIFLCFIVMLFGLYIAIRYNCVSMVVKINKLDKELVGLKTKSIKMKTKYQQTISMRYLNERLSSKNISESKEPVKDIIIIE